METEAFLDRVVAPGAYLGVAFKGKYPMGHRFTPRDQVSKAVYNMGWMTQQGSDIYFAVSSYGAIIAPKLDPKGKPTERGVRTADNVELIKAFWIDLDVARAGDGKDPAHVYADRAAALAWLTAFCAATGLPPPNLVVDSGYGFHVYWTLETAMTRVVWHPYADALKAMMVANSYIGDLQRTADAASILRPPGTLNMKSGTGVPVTVDDSLTLADYPNEDVLALIRPHVNASTTVGAAPTASGLAGGAPAAAFAGMKATMNVAAQVGTPYPKAKFELIATRCEQVKQSMANGGNGDRYELWYLGHLSLAYHCSDGDHHVHEISKGDKRYDKVKVDEYIAQVAKEKVVKGTGPPRCTAYEGYRRGVCNLCPHQGKLVSPWTLGADNGDLPPDYRRKNGWIERRVINGDKEDTWRRVVEGDVYGPVVDPRPNGKGFSLNFTYEFANKRYAIHAAQHEMPADAGAISPYFTSQGVALLDLNAVEFRRFVMAWISHLRRGNLIRSESIYPWGYSVDAKGEQTGLAVGGDLYRPDGSVEAAPGGDMQMVTDFAPRGDKVKWLPAFRAVCKDRLDLQTLVACSFGAPLMDFTGQSGLLVSAWSGSSGVGKSSALRVGQAIWSSGALVSSIDPTENALIGMLGALKCMPFYWDEMQVGKESKEIVKAAMNVVQGTSKRRMDQNASLKGVQTWRTIIVVCANAPVMDHASGNTDAVALRCFEFEIRRPVMNDAPVVAQIVAELGAHYGHIGREYANYIAQHLDSVREMVSNVSIGMNKELKAGAEERLYIAGMAAIYAGARIANAIGVAEFDTVGLKEFLYSTFRTLRLSRKTNLLSNNGVFNVYQLLADFDTDHVAQKMITTEFRVRGTVSKAFVIWMAPPAQNKLALHIAATPLLGPPQMRINKTALVDWCRRKNLSPSHVIDNFKALLKAREYRDRRIGEGTDWATGRLNLLEIDLNTPDLEDFAPDPTVYAKGTVPILAAAPTTVGNKPKV